MKSKLVALFIATFLTFTLITNIPAYAVKPAMPKQRSFFSLDPDSTRQRVSASQWFYYFIDSKSNLYELNPDDIYQRVEGGASGYYFTAKENYDYMKNAKVILTDVVEVAASDAISFAVKADGSLWSWGSERVLGYTDLSTSANPRLPRKVIDNVSYVYAHVYNLCYAVLTDNSLWGWGFAYSKHDNIYLGNGNKAGSVEPTKILDSVADISVFRADWLGDGATNSFALKTDGSLWAWGPNELGALGLGYATDVLFPQKVMDDVKSIGPVNTIYNAYAYTIKEDGTLWTWVWGLSDSPVKTMENIKAADIGIALKEDGSLWTLCITKTSSDEDTSTYSLTPVKILDSISEVCVENEKYYAVSNDGSLYIFDYEGHYTMENDEVIYSKGNPEILMQGIRHVFVEDRYGAGLGARVYVIKTDGSLWGWGKDFAQYPHGYINPEYKETWYNKPQELIHDTIIHRAYAGNGVEYVITEDGSLWWYTLYPSEATPVMSARITDNVEQVAVGHYNAMILKKDGNFLFWTNSVEKSSTWAQVDVTTAINNGLVPQSLQKEYTQAATRAEFCAFAVNLYEKVMGKEITERLTFTDTTDINVEKMAALGVVNGIGNNRFNPNASLTREQAATMLSRLADAIGKPLPKQTATFSDNATISSWAFEAVGQMLTTGIMSGVGDNTFAPKNPYTREQSIVTILRLYNNVCG